MPSLVEVGEHIVIARAGRPVVELITHRKIERSPEVRFSSISIADQADAGRAARPSPIRHDPFDRLLLTHALSLGIQLLTADRVLLALPGAPVIDARA